jgi:hypothetical protein
VPFTRWHPCCIDSAGLGGIHSNRHVNSHARFERGNGRSLPVYGDLRKLRDRECSCHFSFGHSNRVPGHAGNNWRLILRRRGGFLLLASGKSWSSRQHNEQNGDDNEQPALHGFRLNRTAQEMKDKVYSRLTETTSSYNQHCSHGAVRRLARIAANHNISIHSRYASLRRRHRLQRVFNE